MVEFRIGILVLTGTSFATGFEGGPVFSLLFIGRTPRTGIIGNSNVYPTRCRSECWNGRCCMCCFSFQLTISLLPGLLGRQTDLLPVTGIGTVTGLIISKALTPLLPKRGIQSEH